MRVDGRQSQLLLLLPASPMGQQQIAALVQRHATAARQLLPVA
jgi:hypothetical protein